MRSSFVFCLFSNSSNPAHTLIPGTYVYVYVYVSAYPCVYRKRSDSSEWVCAVCTFGGSIYVCMTLIVSSMPVLFTDIVYCLRGNGLSDRVYIRRNKASHRCAFVCVTYIGVYTDWWICVDERMLCMAAWLPVAELYCIGAQKVCSYVCIYLCIYVYVFAHTWT